MKTFTQTKWTIEPHGNTHALYENRDNYHHGLRLMNLDDGDKNFEQNAKLICSAPELLSACEVLQMRLEMLINLTPTSELRNQLTEENIMVMALIEKATGI